MLGLLYQMTRYILEQEKVMHKCPICANEYKNSRSLASHTYICRKKTPDDKSKTLKSVVLNPITEAVTTQKTQRQEDSNSDQSLEYGSYIEDNRKSGLNIDNWTQKDELECQSDTHHIVKRHEHRRTNKSKRATKIRNLADQAKLIKMLCKSILDGTIPLEPHYVSILKPHKIVVRKIAYNTMKEAKNVIQKGGRSLQTILETVVSILMSLLF